VFETSGSDAGGFFIPRFGLNLRARFSCALFFIGYLNKYSNGINMLRRNCPVGSLFYADTAE